MNCHTLLSVLVGLLIASSALAAPGDRTQTRQPTGPRTSLILSCDIDPAAAPRSNEFQATSATVTVSSGALAANRLVEIRLGGARGSVIGSVCSDSFGRAGATTTVAIAPAITDPNYSWRCAARQTQNACPSAPH